MVRTTNFDIARHYSRMQILTASRPKAVCMLHEKVVSLLHRARGDPEQRRYLLDRAQNILVQLQAAVRDDDSVAHSLFLLYDYCYALLERGDPPGCENAEQIMTMLGTTFLYLMRRL
jgi:flagellin-specific chaperone FliS